MKPSNSAEIGKQCMPTGTVKWFSVAKGFGFITPDDGTATYSCISQRLRKPIFRPWRTALLFGIPLARGTGKSLQKASRSFPSRRHLNASLNRIMQLQLSRKNSRRSGVFDGDSCHGCSNRERLRLTRHRSTLCATSSAALSNNHLRDWYVQFSSKCKYGI